MIKDKIITLELEQLSELSEEDIFQKYDVNASGLSQTEAVERSKRFGYNEIKENQEKAIILEFLSKFFSPLVGMLLVVSIVSFYLGEKINSIIVIAMALLSSTVSFIQEHRASRNAEKLAEMVRTYTTAIRGKKTVNIKLREIVPGDIIEFSAGNMIPADARIINSRDLFINQSTLNGESFPSEKFSELSDKDKTTSSFDLSNIVFMGSSVASGTGRAVVIKTGKNTLFGQLSHELAKVDSETAFDRGIKNYTWLILRLIIILGTFIFLSNSFLKHNFVEALLFALAMAVGLAPEMLPMLITVNLSKGAMQMAKKKVVIKKLDSIQNFGAMDILCTDKTSTLTLDNIALIKHTDPVGGESEEVLRFAHMNSYFQTGLKNVLDKAILKHGIFRHKNIIKIDEIPFDFVRRIMSVIVKKDDEQIIVSKGAPEEIFKRCKYFELKGKKLDLTPSNLKKIVKYYDELSAQGFRVLAVAYRVIKKDEIELKSCPSGRRAEKEIENGLVLKGFASFLDPPKPTVIEALNELENLGVKLKILTGDNELVTKKICSEVGISINNMLTGSKIDEMNDQELKNKADSTNVFVRLNPLQKQRVVQILQSNKHIVGFLGDGINDAPALKVADVGISVDNASDIAKETASIILLEKDLRVLVNCITEGRKIFANVIKYIKMGASSNLGNMISLTCASAFLPFLPMLPSQILLNNFLYDLSQVAIPTDNVDADYLKTPRPWNIKFIKEFMLFIGPISSIFDFATFGVMWFVFHASPELFRTGWFVESLTTQTLVIYVIRTSKIPFLQSRPSKPLFYSALLIVLGGMVIPYIFIGKIFSFTPLPILFFVILALMSFLYLLLVQFVKSLFIKKYGYE